MKRLVEDQSNAISFAPMTELEWIDYFRGSCFKVKDGSLWLGDKSIGKLLLKERAP